MNAALLLNLVQNQKQFLIENNIHEINMENTWEALFKFANMKLVEVFYPRYELVRDI